MKKNNPVATAFAFLGIVGATLLFAALPASATLIAIDFEADGDPGDPFFPGPVPLGFESVDATGIHFSTIDDAGIRTGGFVTSAGGGQTDGISFIGSESCRTCFKGISIDFDFFVTSLSFQFGGDQPVDSSFTNPGDLAVLTLFSGGSQVGQSVVAQNQNDVMDQTIAFTGAEFHQATFFFTDLSQGSVFLIAEIIDNIVLETNFDPAPLVFGPSNDIPEPSTLALFLTGLAGLGLMMRRRRGSQIRAFGHFRLWPGADNH